MDLFVVLVFAFANTKTFFLFFEKKFFCAAEKNFLFFLKNQKKMTIQKKNVII